MGIILAWCGFPLPAKEGTVVGNLDNVFADIGDEQSIEQNLSTFSAHLKNIIHILSEATRSSLVLLDELGAGTDPQEGAALGIALIDTLREKKSITLATTHHNPIKSYALTTPHVETASMEFNVETLRLRIIFSWASRGEVMPFILQTLRHAVRSASEGQGDP